MIDFADNRISHSHVRKANLSSHLKTVPEMVSNFDLPSPESFPGPGGFGSALVEEADDFVRTCAHVSGDITQKPVAQLEKELWSTYRSALQQGHVTKAHSTDQYSLSDKTEREVSTVPWLPDVRLPATRNRPSHLAEQRPEEAAPNRPPEPPASVAGAGRVASEGKVDMVASGDESLVHIVPGQLFFLVISSFKDPRLHATRNSYQYVTSMAHCSYDRTQSNFEPVSMAQVNKFCQFMSAKVRREKSATTKPIVYLCKPKYKHCSSATFLIASYLVLELGWSVEEAVKPFLALGDDLLRPFHNVSITDSIRGLLKARNNAWVHKFDPARYESLTDPSNGAITQICPKFVAFKGPDAASELDCELQLKRTAQTLHEMGVQAVVRLNDAESYATAAFSALGMKHIDLSYEGYAVPQSSVVTKFLDICQQYSGAIAVHCGLGGTGTMMALWMMRNHEFTAGEAMGFVRVMRPGCVVGKQHKLLLQLEGATWLGNTPTVPAKADGSSVGSSKPGGANSPTTDSSSLSLSSLSSSSSSLLALSDRDGGTLFRQASQRSVSSTEAVAVI